MNLNERARKRADALERSAAELRVSVTTSACGARVIDCGVSAVGGLEAGRQLAEICLANLASVSLVPCPRELGGGVAVAIATDQPLGACMAAQYAGWQISVGKFFAMGSGPMRAAWGGERLFDDIGLRESPDCAVGVLETGKLPPDEVARQIAESCKVAPSELTLCVARTASIAGTVQVVARSVETALHKMHELGFDLRHVASGHGVAPLPPIAADDLVAIGRTNDAVLYGGDVTLWVRAEDEQLAELGPRIPSSASRDFGQPFGEIFERYGRDFYKIDPLLFSPAAITLVNLTTGRAHRFGQPALDVLRQSFVG